MTSTLDPVRHDDRRRRSTPTWHARTTAEVLLSQVAAIDSWHAARHAAGADQAPAQTSREARMDLTRLEQVVRREHAALVAHTEAQMNAGLVPLATSPPPRAVVAHRSDWFRDAVVKGLAAGGVQVVAALDNGADVVGLVVAEQPDLLLVEDKLPMLSGRETLRRALQFSSGTIATAQASSDADIADLMDAGACTVFTRRVRPADVATALCVLVRS